MTNPYLATDLTQPHERSDNILVALVDETYGVSDEAAWDTERERFRVALEAEFGVPFEDANIGPGADLPSFATLLQIDVPAWSLLVAAFFGGKSVKENLDAWLDIAKRVRTFFKRPLYLNRHGAASVAVEAAITEAGITPLSLKLLSYRVSHLGVPLDLADLPHSTEIADAPATLFLGFIRHIFEIEIDGSVYRVAVDGRETEALKII